MSWENSCALSKGVRGGSVRWLPACFASPSHVCARSGQWARPEWPRCHPFFHETSQPPAVTLQASPPYLQNGGKTVSSELLSWSVVTA